MEWFRWLQFITFLFSGMYFIPCSPQTSWEEPSEQVDPTQYTHLQSPNYKAWMDQCRMIPIQHTHLGSLNQAYVYYFIQDHTNTVAEESCSSIHGNERPENCVIGMIKLVDKRAGNVCILTKNDSAAKRSNITITEEEEYRSTIQQLGKLWDQQCRQEVASLFGSISRFQLQRLWLTIDGFVHQMSILGQGEASMVYVKNGSHTKWLHHLLAMMGVKKAEYGDVSRPSAMIIVLSNPCLLSHLQSPQHSLHACPALQQQMVSTLQFVQQQIQQQPTLPMLLIILNYHSQFHQPIWASLLQHFPWHAPFMPHVGVYQPIQIFRRLGSGVGLGIGLLNISMDEPRLFLEHNQYMFISHFYPHMFGTCSIPEKKRGEEGINERVGEKEDSRGRVRWSVVSSSTKTCFFPPSMHTTTNKSSRRKQRRTSGLTSGWYHEDDLQIVMTSLEFKHILRHADMTTDGSDADAESREGIAGGGSSGDVDDASINAQLQSSSSSSPFPTNPHPTPSSIPATSTPITTTQTANQPSKRSCLIISVSYGIHFPHWAQQAFLAWSMIRWAHALEVPKISLIFDQQGPPHAWIDMIRSAIEHGPMHSPLKPIHTSDSNDTQSCDDGSNLVNDNDPVHGDENDKDNDQCRVYFDHNDTASNHDNTDSVSFIHGWQSWKAHQLCSSLQYTILENHHSGDQSWRGNEKWFLHPDDALTLREVVLGSIGLEKGRDDDDHDNDDDDDDVCMHTNMTTTPPSSSSASALLSTHLRGVILDRLTTRRLLNLHDTYTELHRVLSLFISNSAEEDMDSISTSTMPSSAGAATASLDSSNHPPHPSTNNTDPDMIKIVNFESITPQQQVHTLAHTDILLATHGAGLVNIAFMLPCSIVIELFPWGYVIPGYYGGLARDVGLIYRYVRSVNVTVELKGLCDVPGIDHWDCEVIPDVQEDVPHPNPDEGVMSSSDKRVAVSHNMSKASFVCRNCVREHGNVWVDLRRISFADVVMDALNERKLCLLRTMGS